MTEVAQSPIAARSSAGHSATFGGITTTTPPPAPDARPNGPNFRPDFTAIHHSAEFARLRSRFRRFVFPMSALFLAWYLTYVLLAAYARDFMSQKVLGAVNVGLVLGLLQFVSTIAITAGYLRYARNKIDPAAAAIREGAGVNAK